MNATSRRVEQSFLLGSCECPQSTSALVVLLLAGLLAWPAIAAEQNGAARSPEKAKSSGAQAKDKADAKTDKDLNGDNEFDAHGYDIVRIEQEDKITVPLDKADEVWNFIKNYLANDSETLKKLGPKFTSFWSEELFTDTYYDTPSLSVYGKAGGVRHRRRKNLSNPNDIKSGRELMQIKINGLSSNELERGELKYEIEYPTMIKTAEDAHPMLGIVKPAHREDFKQRLNKLGIDPYSMRPILTVSDIRRRVYVRLNNQPFLSVSFDNASSELLWAKWHFYEIEPELNEIPFTEGDEKTRKYMESINNEIIGTLMKTFPYLKRDLTPKYCKAFNAFEAQIPMYRSLIKTNLDNSQSMYLSGSLGIAAVFGAAVFVKRWRSKPTA